MDGWLPTDRVASATVEASRRLGTSSPALSPPSFPASGTKEAEALASSRLAVDEGNQRKGVRKGVCLDPPIPGIAPFTGLGWFNVAPTLFTGSHSLPSTVRQGRPGSFLESIYLLQC